MLDTEWKYAGCCARRGWASAAADVLSEVIASARGRPPSWTGGIHGAELWGLLLAAHSSLSDSDFRVDCMAVQLGAQRGTTYLLEAHLFRILTIILSLKNQQAAPFLNHEEW